jgi:hypothetical protein
VQPKSHPPRVRFLLTTHKIAMGEVERDAVDQRLVVEALGDFSEVFREIKPYEQKELMRLVLHKAILGPDYMKMALYGRPPAIGPLSGSESRFQTFDWLPGLVSQSAILWDIVRIKAKRIARGHVRLSALPHLGMPPLSGLSPEAARAT